MFHIYETRELVTQVQNGWRWLMAKLQSWLTGSKASNGWEVGAALLLLVLGEFIPRGTYASQA